MKPPLSLPALLACLSLGHWGCGDHDHHDHDGHDHGAKDHANTHAESSGESAKSAKKIAGPNGGRLITTVTPAVEFFVTPDRKIRLTFLDAGLKKAVPAGEQIATVVAGDRSAPTRLDFVRDGDTLLSDGVLPAGDDYPTVLQIKMGADASPGLAKFNLNLAQCPTCEHREYACTCEHES